MSSKKSWNISHKIQSQIEETYENCNIDMEENIDMKSDNDSENFQNDSDCELIEWISNDQSYRVNRPILEEK